MTTCRFTHTLPAHLHWPRLPVSELTSLAVPHTKGFIIIHSRVFPDKLTPNALSKRIGTLMASTRAGPTLQMTASASRQPPKAVTDNSARNLSILQAEAL